MAARPSCEASYFSSRGVGRNTNWRFRRSRIPWLLAGNIWGTFLMPRWESRGLSVGLFLLNSLVRLLLRGLSNALVMRWSGVQIPEAAPSILGCLHLDCEYFASSHSLVLPRRLLLRCIFWNPKTHQQARREGENHHPSH